ncbi:hypothetical protein EDB80DRAFT_571969, partial [Ilyonectria destructans]
DYTILSTFSIYSNIIKYQEENRRIYYIYKDRKYLSLNNKQENNYLNLQYYLFILIFRDKLYIYSISTVK